MSNKIEGTIVLAGTDTDGTCRLIVYVSPEDIKNFTGNLIYNKIEIGLLDEKEKQ